MKLNYFKAKVTAVNGRLIKMTSPVATWDVEIPPFLDGVLKLPAPEVDDSVIVFIADEHNQVLYYLPVDYTFANLTDTSTDVQIENTQGNVHIEGTEILLGASASDYVALSTLVKDEIQAVVNTILGWTPVPNDGGAALKAAFAGYTVADVGATKTKAE